MCKNITSSKVRDIHNVRLVVHYKEGREKNDKFKPYKVTYITAIPLGTSIRYRKIALRRGKM